MACCQTCSRREQATWRLALFSLLSPFSSGQHNKLHHPPGVRQEKHYNKGWQSQAFPLLTDCHWWVTLRVSLLPLKVLFSPWLRIKCNCLTYIWGLSQTGPHLSSHSLSRKLHSSHAGLNSPKLSSAFLLPFFAQAALSPGMPLCFYEVSEVFAVPLYMNTCLWLASIYLCIHLWEQINIE